MAIVKQCDRCSKIYNHYPDPMSPPYKYNALRRITMNASNTDEQISQKSHIDLCRECMCDFDSFMSMKEYDPTDQTIIFNNIKYKRVSKEDL